MLTAETKRHIDAARQVLVGVVPNPSSQIDQITNALIYKFMDDMDQMAIKAGGKPSFFTGDLERYAWTRLMDSRIGNQDRMNLYSEALAKFSEAKQLPQLFRDIFKQAFLPHRSPEVLGLFLKEVAYFDYTHSEELGNAFEYLLSIMGSQGDAGQFRTPRHIIDFIVEVVDPSKSDRVLDPACGTAGFLISAYKHILAKHDGKNEDGTKNDEKPLTADEKKKLTQNFEGYDVSPEMVRLSRVNMYLHQFKNPNIYEYNTLSQEERWSDKHDIILANPPFMSPKGGVKTHSRFSIPSTRSEVLFVDYIMDHLRPKGRAGIIVPEGIIFQSGTAYKQLRKKLVEDGLWAVVSLPSGVFNPYAGVKTSVLLFDNDRAKQTREILFVKIENDGYDLGAQRRQIQKNDLPEAAQVLENWKLEKKVESRIALYVERAKIAETGDYNLSSDRYRVATDYTNAKWPMVELGEVAEVLSGGGFPKDEQGLTGGHIPFLKVSDMNLQGNEMWMNHANNYVTRDALKKLKVKTAPAGSIIFPKIGAAIATNKKRVLVCESAYDNNVMGLIPSPKIVSLFLCYLMRQFNLSEWASSSALPSIRKSDVEKQKIPLPPLEIQKQIVAELDGYTAIITGAKQIVENWKPKIDIDPEWGTLIFSDAVDFQEGPGILASDFMETGVPLIRLKGLEGESVTLAGCNYLNENKVKSKWSHFRLQEKDILLSSSGSLGRVSEVNANAVGAIPYTGIIRFRTKNNSLVLGYLKYYLLSEHFTKQALLATTGVTLKHFGPTHLKKMTIPLPPIDMQKQIVEKIEAERALVESAKKLIELYEGKTKEAIAKLWSQ